jgi:chromosome partitioning protein
MTSQTTQTSRICFFNQKGGTGKTTVAINVAGALSKRDRDVLFVDVDPQGNATEGLGLPDEYDARPPTIFDVITDREARKSIDSLIVEHEEFDILPANVDLLNIEYELTIADLMGRMSDPEAQEILADFAINVDPSDLENRHAKGMLSKALDAINYEYDYLLIDAPPFFGEISDNALYASRNVLIPSLTESTSQRAIELLFDQFDGLEEETGITIRDIGAIANRVESTKEAEKMKDWLATAFPDVPVWNIRKRVALQRAYAAGVSIFEHTESSDMEEVFMEIATELDDEFGKGEPA